MPHGQREQPDARPPFTLHGDPTAQVDGPWLHALRLESGGRPLPFAASAKGK